MAEDQNAKLRPAIAVSLGAIAGALCRYVLGQLLPPWGPANFPVGTFLTNISGCFLMGLVTTLAQPYFARHPDRLLMLTTGFLGSYTTFSSYTLEVDQLGDRPGILSDLLYWLGTPLLGLAAFGIGVLLARRTESP